MILSYFGLSFDRWKQGFSSQEAVFAWVATSPLFQIWNMTQGSNWHCSRKLVDRSMYQDFLAYARVQHLQNPTWLAEKLPLYSVESALAHFNKLDLHTALLHVARVKERAKTAFSNKRVEEWTDMRGPPVSLIMTEVRRKLGGNAVLATVCGVSRDAALDNDIDPIHLTLTMWENALDGMTDEEVYHLVLQVKEDLSTEGALNISWKELKILKRM